MGGNWQSTPPSCAPVSRTSVAHRGPAELPCGDEVAYSAVADALGRLQERGELVRLFGSLAGCGVTMDSLTLAPFPTGGGAEVGGFFSGTFGYV